jgi:hypothetical protein
MVDKALIFALITSRTSIIALNLIDQTILELPNMCILLSKQYKSLLLEYDAVSNRPQLFNTNFDYVSIFQILWVLH